MIIDSSVLVAILLGEPEAQTFADLIGNDPKKLTSALSVLESAIVMQWKKGTGGSRELDLLLYKTQIEIVSLNEDQVKLAREAHAKFGKGNHPAKLNLGDCCSYALSRYSGEPLLFKGDDFSKTDVAVVSY